MSAHVNICSTRMCNRNGEWISSRLFTLNRFLKKPIVLHFRARKMQRYTRSYLYSWHFCSLCLFFRLILSPHLCFLSRLCRKLSSLRTCVFCRLLNRCHFPFSRGKNSSFDVRAGVSVFVSSNRIDDDWKQKQKNHTLPNCCIKTENFPINNKQITFFFRSAVVFFMLLFSAYCFFFPFYQQIDPYEYLYT